MYSYICSISYLKNGGKREGWEEKLKGDWKSFSLINCVKIREEVACLTKDFGKYLENSKTVTILLKFHQHPHDKSGLGFENGTSSSKSQSVSNKYGFYGKFGHSKFTWIHKKKQMSKETNYVGPKKICVEQVASIT